MNNDHRTVDELIADHRPGYALEQRFYTDPAIYNLEVEKIINCNWILAGHTSQIPAPGDFKVLNVGLESAIIVRGKDGELKGFANVCRHRGSLVCLELHGHAEKFVCPYHGWTYDLDGHLVAARDMDDAFDMTDHRLKTVSVGTIHGLIFVCFSDTPPRLDGAVLDLEEAMALFDFPNLKVAAQKRYPISANWKLSVENYQECYHCSSAHPEYASMHTMTLHGKKRERASLHLQNRMTACGIPDLSLDFSETKTRPGEIGFSFWRTAMFANYKTGSKGGEPVAPLLGAIKGYDGGQADFTFGAFSYLLAYNDHVVCYVFTPIDRRNSACEVYWLVRGDAEEDKDYDRQALTWLWDLTMKADQKIIANNWKGVQSRYYRPGPLSRMEASENNYIHWVLAQLQRA